MKGMGSPAEIYRNNTPVPALVLCFGSNHREVFALVLPLSAFPSWLMADLSSALHHRPGSLAGQHVMRLAC